MTRGENVRSEIALHKEKAKHTALRNEQNPDFVADTAVLRDAQRFQLFLVPSCIWWRWKTE